LFELGCTDQLSKFDDIKNLIKKNYHDTQILQFALSSQYGISLSPKILLYKVN
jgi:hypothetical protein